jgi:hypothetical protein
MPLSITPTDVWRLFSDKKRRSKEDIAAWLDHVAADARQIATVWATVANEFDRQDLTKWRVLPNGPAYCRLEQLYETASTVFAGRVPERFGDKFLDAIASVVMKRRDIVTLYRALSRSQSDIWPSTTFVDDLSSEDQLKDLSSAIELLNREAAALEVLAGNFRASA